MYSVLQLGKYSCGHGLSKLTRTCAIPLARDVSLPCREKSKSWTVSLALGTLVKEVKIFYKVTNRKDSFHHTAPWIRLGRSPTKIRSPARKINPIILGAFTIIKERISRIR